VVEAYATVSVIIVTFKRPGRLKQCLASLAQQSVKPDEIIVVDNDPSEINKKQFCAYAEWLKPALCYIPGKNGRIASGRNAGARLCRGEIAAFIDDDCIAEKSWVENIKAAYRRYPESSAIGGRVENARADKVIPRLQQYIHVLWFNLLHPCPRNDGGLRRLYVLPGESYPVSSLTTNNLSYRKNALAAAGYFNESLVTNEDAELNLRITKAGGRILYDPAVTVYHCHRRSLRAYIGQSFAFGRGLRQWGERQGLQANSLLGLRLKEKCRYAAAMFLYPLYILICLRKPVDALLVLPVFLIREACVSLGYFWPGSFGDPQIAAASPETPPGFFQLRLDEQYAPQVKGLGELYEIRSVNRLKRRLLRRCPEGVLFLAARRGLTCEACRCLEEKIRRDACVIVEKGLVDAPPWPSRPRKAPSLAVRQKWLMSLAGPLLGVLVNFEFLWRRKAHMAYYCVRRQ